MTVTRWIALGYAAILWLVATLNYWPGLTDSEGRVLGVFALDFYDDALHFVSGAWALVAAFVSTRASRIFLQVFGALYLLDGLMGLAVGTGYLDLGILIYGVLDLPFEFRIKANTPHILLGGVALVAGAVLDRPRRLQPA